MPITLVNIDYYEFCVIQCMIQWARGFQQYFRFQQHINTNKVAKPVQEVTQYLLVLNISLTPLFHQNISISIA